MTARERLGVRVLQGRGATAGHRAQIWWVMAVDVVVRGMTACSSVAAAVVVVTLPLVVAVLVAIAVDGVALSFLRSFLQYFIPSVRASKLFLHLQHRSGASPFIITSSARSNGRQRYGVGVAAAAAAVADTD